MLRDDHRSSDWGLKQSKIRKSKNQDSAWHARRWPELVKRNQKHQEACQQREHTLSLPSSLPPFHPSPTHLTTMFDDAVDEENVILCCALWWAWKKLCGSRAATGMPRRTLGTQTREKGLELDEKLRGGVLAHLRQRCQKCGEQVGRERIENYRCERPGGGWCHAECKYRAVGVAHADYPEVEIELMDEV